MGKYFLKTFYVFDKFFYYFPLSFIYKLKKVNFLGHMDQKSCESFNKNIISFYEIRKEI